MSKWLRQKKSVDETAETETETKDDSKGENVIEVTSEGTSQLGPQVVGCSPDASF